MQKFGKQTFQAEEMVCANPNGGSVPALNFRKSGTLYIVLFNEPIFGEVAVFP